MKVFNWISKKTSRAQPEISSKNAGDRVQWMKKNTQQQDKFTKQDQGALFSLHDPVVNENCNELVPKQQRREIVKIFVNYEEYGLLAIGTLGYDPSTGVEPEFELFELKPGALQGIRDKQEQHLRPQQECIEAGDMKQKDKSSTKSFSKKLFPLEGLTHMPHIGAGFLKGSKLADRILRPLNYLKVSRSLHMSVPSSPSSADENDKISKNKKKTGFTSKLKALTHMSNSNIKSNKSNMVSSSNNNVTSSSNRKQITYEDDQQHHYQPNHHQMQCKSPRRNKLKGTFSHFSCVGNFNESESESESESEPEDQDQDQDEKERNIDRQASKDDSEEDESPSCARDVLQQGYWIRTESDYVVLEL